MNKAFTKESDDNEEEDDLPESSLPQGFKNYVTPKCYAAYKTELEFLVKDERPRVVSVVHWAAGNGDRSENGDYIYGKRRLREIDRRIRFLTKRLDFAEVVDPLAQPNKDQVFFGATVTILDDKEEEHVYQIVGLDEIEVGKGRISWISPMAKALLKAKEGDVVRLQSPIGIREIEVLEIVYQTIE